EDRFDFLFGKLIRAEPAVDVRFLDEDGAAIVAGLAHLGWRIVGDQREGVKIRRALLAPFIPNARNDDPLEASRFELNDLALAITAYVFEEGRDPANRMGLAV